MERHLGRISGAFAGFVGPIKSAIEGLLGVINSVVGAIQSLIAAVSNLPDLSSIPGAGVVGNIASGIGRAFGFAERRGELPGRPGAGGRARP